MQRRHWISLVTIAQDFAIGVILIYGYIYTAYKFGDPLLGRNDFFKYKEMVAAPFDFSATTAPFVLRQIPTAVAAAFYKLGLSYDTTAVVDLIGFDRDTKRRYLALIASNGLAVCLSFTVLCHYLRLKRGALGMTNLFALFGLFAAWFYFPSGTIAPTTVGWGWFASSLLVIAFVERSLLLTCLACLIALFSRETTLIFAFVMFCAAWLLKVDRSRDTVYAALVLLAGGFIYLLLRATFASGYEHQISPRHIVDSLTSFRLTRDFVFQSILSQGLFAILIVGISVKAPRYAACLCIAAAAVIATAIGARVSETALVTGETLPFFAVIFVLAQDGRLPQAPAALSP